MHIWHIIIEPALVTVGGVWGIWYLSQPKTLLKGTMRDRLISVGGTFTKSPKPMQRISMPQIAKWKPKP